MSKFCPNCGKKLADDAVFCDSCGTRMPDMEAPASREEVPAKEQRRPKSSAGKLILLAVAALAVVAAVLFVPKLFAKDEPNYSTYNKPEMSDFDWYFGGVETQGVPSGWEKMKTWDGIKGGWKVVIDYNPLMYEFGTLSFSGTAGNLEAKLSYTSRYNFSDQTVTEQTSGDLYFDGKFSNGALTTKSAGWGFVIKGFYTFGNKQYAVGVLQGPEGTAYPVALVRP